MLNRRWCYKNFEIMIKLKYLISFLGNLEMPLINCKVNLIQICSVNCTISNAAADQASTFAITDTKLCASIVTLSTLDNVNLLPTIKLNF